MKTVFIHLFCAQIKGLTRSIYNTMNDDVSKVSLLTEKPAKLEMGDFPKRLTANLNLQKIQLSF